MGESGSVSVVAGSLPWLDAHPQLTCATWLQVRPPDGLLLAEVVVSLLLQVGVMCSSPVLRRLSQVLAGEVLRQISRFSVRTVTSANGSALEE